MSICSTCFSFCFWHEWMQNVTGLVDVTVLKWKQDSHSGVGTGRKNEKSEGLDIISIVLAVCSQCFLLCLFLACGSGRGEKARSSQKEALQLFPNTGEATLGQLSTVPWQFRRPLLSSGLLAGLCVAWQGPCSLGCLSTCPHPKWERGQCAPLLLSILLPHQCGCSWHWVPPRHLPLGGGLSSIPPPSSDRKPWTK